MITEDSILSNMAMKNSNLDIISFVRRIVKFDLCSLSFKTSDKFEVFGLLGCDTAWLATLCHKYTAAEN